MGAFVAFEEMFDVKMVDTEALRPQTSKIEQARTAVTTAGIAISDQFAAFAILRALPPSYSSIGSTIIATTTLATLKPSDVIPKIIEEESLRKSQSASLARVSTTTPLPKRKCATCGRTNHTTENHWPDGRRPPGWGKGKGKETAAVVEVAPVETVQSIRIVELPDVASSSSGNAINVSLYSVSDTAMRWMVDSGCTAHVTNTLSDFSQYRPFTVPGKAHLAGKTLYRHRGEGGCYASPHQRRWS